MSSFVSFHPSSSILPIFLLKSKGNQKFSYCYVADAASGIFKVLLDGINGEAYNVSDEDEGITLGGYAEFMAKLAGKNVVYQIEDDAAASRACAICTSIMKSHWQIEMKHCMKVRKQWRSGKMDL